MTVREVQGFLANQYGVDVSSEFISSVTDAVMAEVGAWQGPSSDKFRSPVHLAARAIAWRRTDLERWSDSRPTITH